MAIQRTADQQGTTEIKREILYHFKSEPHRPAPGLNTSDSKYSYSNTASLLHYPVKLIYQDLIKTIGLTLVMICALVALKILNL